MTSIALNNSERLILLINDILDIEKVESGGMRFEMKRYDIEALVTQAVQDNQSYGEKYGVQFVLHPLPSTVLVSVDKNRIMQVFSNLMSNAAKFSVTGEDVRIVIENLQNRVRVNVINKGAGIPKEFRSRIFGKFAQADSSSTRQKGGTGLGLNISKQLIENMNGQIGFVSEPGVETSFWIELPQVEAA